MSSVLRSPRRPTSAAPRVSASSPRSSHELQCSLSSTISNSPRGGAPKSSLPSSREVSSSSYKRTIAQSSSFEDEDDAFTRVAPVRILPSTDAAFSDDSAPPSPNNITTGASSSLFQDQSSVIFGTLDSAKMFLPPTIFLSSACEDDDDGTRKTTRTTGKHQTSPRNNTASHADMDSCSDSDVKLGVAPSCSRRPNSEQVSHSLKAASNYNNGLDTSALNTSRSFLLRERSVGFDLGTDRSGTFDRSATMTIDHKKLIHDRRQQEAKERMAAKIREEQEKKESDLMMTAMRMAEAVERKQAMGDHRRWHRAIEWLPVVQVISFHQMVVNILEESRMKRMKELKFLPHVMMRVRRALRRARCHLLGKNASKPSIQSLRFDKMLNLFSDAHLQHLVDHLELRYYFENETIIFMGMEDDEGYVLHQGTADVMMGSNKVFTLKSGMSFGTVGMISGEPRTASIVAREPCLVWCIKRSQFESYGTADNQVEAALAMISELRQTNMRNVYKNILTSTYLRTFPSMHNVSSETLDSLSVAGVPKVIKAGVVLMYPSMPPNEVPHLLVLRGSMRVSLIPGITPSPEFSLKEHVSRLIDLPTKKIGIHSGDNKDNDIVMTAWGRASVSMVMASEAARRRSTVTAVDSPDVARMPSQSSVFAQVASSGLRQLTVVHAPFLLNVALMLLQEVSPFLVETVSGCDVLEMTKEMVMSQDVLELAVIRQNCHNLHCRYMPPLTRPVLMRALFKKCPATASLSFLDVLKNTADALPRSPCVFGINDFLYFDPSHEMELLVVVKGTIDGINTEETVPFEAGGEAYIWPPLHQSYFGSSNVQSRCKTRLEAYKIPRSHFVRWLVDNLDENDFKTFVCSLAQRYVDVSGKRPVFSFFDIDEAPSSARLARLGKAANGATRRGSQANSQSVSVNLTATTFSPAMLQTIKSANEAMSEMFNPKENHARQNGRTSPHRRASSTLHGSGSVGGANHHIPNSGCVTTNQKTEYSQSTALMSSSASPRNQSIGASSYPQGPKGRDVTGPKWVVPLHSSPASRPIFEGRKQPQNLILSPSHQPSPPARELSASEYRHPHSNIIHTESGNGGIADDLRSPQDNNGVNFKTALDFLRPRTPPKDSEGSYRYENYKRVMDTSFTARANKSANTSCSNGIPTTPVTPRRGRDEGRSRREETSMSQDKFQELLVKMRTPNEHGVCSSSFSSKAPHVAELYKPVTHILPQRRSSRSASQRSSNASEQQQRASNGNNQPRDLKRDSLQVGESEARQGGRYGTASKNIKIQLGSERRRTKVAQQILARYERVSTMMEHGKK